MGGGENKALAAETGRDMSNYINDVTGSFERGDSEGTYFTSNLTFHMKPGTILKKGDVLKFNGNFNLGSDVNILDANNNNFGILHTPVRISAVHSLRNAFNTGIITDEIRNMDYNHGHYKYEIVVTSDDPIQLSEFTISVKNRYTEVPGFTQPKTAEMTLITEDNRKIFSKLFTDDNVSSIYTSNNFNVDVNGHLITLQENNKIKDEQSYFNINGNLKNGDIFEFSINNINDSDSYFSQLSKGDIIKGWISERMLLNSNFVRENKNNIIIPKEGINVVSDLKFEILESSSNKIKIKYISKDMNDVQNTIFELPLKVKNSKKGKFKLGRTNENTEIIVNSQLKDGNTFNKALTPAIDISSNFSNFSGIPVDPTYQLTVRYLDENGQQLSNSDKIINENGNDYNISPKDIPKYTFKSANKSLKGNLTEDTTIDLIYSKKQSDLTIKHIDIDTGEEIKDKIIEKKNIDDKYTITPAQINKYDYIEASESLTGTLTAPKEVILKYRKQSKSINVKIVDENGKELKSPTTITKKIGEDYTIEKPNIPNYVFKEVKDNKPLTGKITDNDEVVLVYKLNKHNVTVKYIHRGENGEIEIKSPITKEYTVGDPLNIETPKIDGYKYKESSEPINGKVGDKDKVIKLYYSKYIPGPQGDKGPQGNKGIPGDKGDKGGKGIEGAPGREGHIPSIRIDPKSGNWIVDGEDTGFRAIVFDGKDGQDGKDGNIDYNKVKIHYITPTGEIAKPTETVDKNKVEDKLKEEDPIIAKEKDNSIIAVVPENNKESDNNRKEKEPLIKYNIISDKGEELTSSVYLPKGKELPNITITGHKLLKTEKLSDTEVRVIYSKDNSTSTKVELNNDITYRLVDENNKPISTVKYQDDKFQPELEGYKFKEKKVISEKEIVLVYQKDNIVNNSSDNKIVKNQNENSKESKDNTTISKENTKKEANSNISKQSDENKNTSTANNSVAKNAKIKSIIKAESGEMLETLYLDKDSKPEIKGYKYKETKVIDGNTQELIYTSESPNLRKADVKSGIDGVTSTTVGLFTSIIAVISAVIYRKRKE